MGETEKTLGELIKDELDRQGKSVAWLAKETGIPATTLRSTISRSSNKVSAERIHKIALALNTTIDALTEGKVSFADLWGAGTVEFQADFIINTICDAGYNFEPIKLKDGQSYIIYNEDRKIILTSSEFHEIMRGSRRAASDYFKEAIEKA